MPAERTIPGDLGGSICLPGDPFFDFLNEDLNFDCLLVSGISWGEKPEFRFVGEDEGGLKLDDLRLDWELSIDSSVSVSALKERGAGRGLRLLLLVVEDFSFRSARVLGTEEMI